MENKKKIIYVASQYSGDVVQNTERARYFSRFVAMKCRQAPYTPHLLFTQFMDDDDPEERDLAIELNLEFLEKADELWVFMDQKHGVYIISKGMQLEINHAWALDLKIRFFTILCQPIPDDSPMLPFNQAPKRGILNKFQAITPPSIETSDFSGEIFPSPFIKT